jgi:hypothetical protein
MPDSNSAMKSAEISRFIPAITGLFESGDELCATSPWEIRREPTKTAAGSIRSRFVEDRGLRLFHRSACVRFSVDSIAFRTVLLSMGIITFLGLRQAE